LGTVLLWLVFAINLGEFYALQSWLPSIMTGLNYPMSTVVMATTLTTVGGIAAAFITGPSMDRLGAYKTLGILYLVGFVCVALTGLAFKSPLWMLLTANFLAGCCISGGQKSLIALAAVFYPAPIRSTGVGWALGIGRIGGITGPIVVGAALGMGWSPSAVFYAMAVPMLIAGLLVLFLGRRYGSSTL
jgi:AAHS family 4-hydroxybenzoate transporter-like MFS transporter